MIKITGSIQSVQWSTSEQVYPFEKGLNGETLYCKIVNMNMPSNGISYGAHGLSSSRKFYRMQLFNYDSTPLPRATTNGVDIEVWEDGSNIVVRTNTTGWGTGPIKAYLIYSK